MSEGNERRHTALAPTLGRDSRRLSPAWRFFLGSFLILCIGLAGIGLWVSHQIENGVVHRTASTTAVYVDSLIDVPLQELSARESLSSEGVAELDRLINETSLGQAVALFRIWDTQGRVLYSTDPSQVGQQFPVEHELAQALQGKVSADIGDIETEGTVSPLSSSHDLLEIYSPVRSHGTNNVIAVAEFYYGTEGLRGEISAAQRRSWLVVGGGGVLIYLILAIFVQRASNTIVSQQRALAEQVAQLTAVLALNEELMARVRGAAARTTALNERVLRRLSAELHDGPAQEISLALLRLDHVSAQCASEGFGSVAPEAKAAMSGDLEIIETSLRRALQEVRATSTGLLLPELSGLTVSETVEHAVRAHRRRTGATVEVTLQNVSVPAPLATKIAIYRVVQEALANAWQHAGGKMSAVRVERQNGSISLEVTDQGPGFDASAILGSGDHLGLVGMRERVESLGGVFRIESSSGRGTRVAAELPLEPPGENHA